MMRQKLIAIAVSAAFLLITPTLISAEWMTVTDPFIVVDGQDTTIGDLKPAGDGWVALLKTGVSPSYDILLAKIGVSPDGHTAEITVIDSGFDSTNYLYLYSKLAASSGGDSIAVVNRETSESGGVRYVVRRYDGNLNRQGDDIVIDWCTTGACLISVRLDEPAGIFLADKTSATEYSVVKYDLSGSVQAGPATYDFGDCAAVGNPRPLPDGGVFVPLTWGVCAHNDGELCYISSHYATTLRKLNSDLQPASPEVSLIAGSSWDASCIQMRQEETGGITVLWDEVTDNGMGGFAGTCDVGPIKTYMRKIDADGNVLVDKTLIGDTDRGDYVMGCGSLATRPGGGFSLVESYMIYLHLYPNSWKSPMYLHLYDSSGDIQENPLFFYDSPNNYTYSEGAFDRKGVKFLATWSENSKTVARIMREKVNTLEGIDVSYSDPSGVDVTFGQVTEGGNTSVTVSQNGPPTPNGLRLGSPPVYYQISTDAQWSDGATVCISYDESSFKGPEKNLRLIKMSNGETKDVTASLDTVNNVICGFVDSFSTFMVTEPDPGFPISKPAPYIDSTLLAPGNSCSAGTAGGPSDIMPFFIILLAAILLRKIRRRLPG